MQSEDKNAPLRADIRFLGQELGEVLKIQVGQEFYELEESIRSACKDARKSSTPETQVKNIRQLIATQPPETLIHLTQAFGIYFQLVNLAEQHHRIRRKKDYEAQEHIVNYSLEYLVQHLQKKNLSPEALNECLKRIKVTPVMTAHPTHIMRQTILRKHRRIKQILQSTPQSSREQHLLTQQARHEITTLWQSNPFHKRTITVMDEVENLFTYFDASLFQSVPQIHEELSNELDLEVPNMLKIGSWIGGDRDGHPFVKASTTEKTLALQKDYIIGKYQEELSKLQDHLSMSVLYKSVSPDFLEQLTLYREQYPHLSREMSEKYPDELYRQFLALLRYKLKATQLEQTGAYPNAEGLLKDLTLLKTSLQDHQASICEIHLKPLIRQVKIFGFHLATLDIRQDSAIHLDCVSALFKASGVHDGYASLDEDTKTDLLMKELKNPRPLYHPRQNYSPESTEVFRVFETIKKARDTLGPDCITTYIMSMCRTVSDVLHVLLLCKEFGLAQTTGENPFCELNIVPLFETLEDLQNAPDTMSKIFGMPLYRKCLAHHNHTQEIMLGYSDSSKRAGILAATWQLYKTQQSLTEVAKTHQCKLRFFHGRGGSISRGGGPTHHAIMAQPPETLWGEVRLTEQGEVLSWKYNFPELAHRELSVLLSSVIEVSLEEHTHTANDYPQWLELIEHLGKTSHRVFCELVEHPDFITFFQQSTPIQAISHLNIGSRPSKRKNTRSIEDLRAIPWVFSWMQSRCVLPAWYGVGSAFEALNPEGDTLDTLQDMYKQWRFFQVFIDNLQMTLSKADLHIAQCYMDLVEDEAIRSHFWQQIQNEYIQTQKWLLKITGQVQLLDNKITLKKSINLRNPYVDPLNYIQVEVLKRLKNSPNNPLLDQALKLSIMGISEGLRNTG